MAQEFRDVRSSGMAEHDDHCHQHQQRPEQGVQEELECGIDTARPAPHADDQEHWNQSAFKEQIEQNEVQGGEYPQHQRLKYKECRHVFLDAVFDTPTGHHHNRHQEGSKQYERQRNTVHTQLVREDSEPHVVLDGLKAGNLGIECPQHRQCESERGK